MGNRNGQSSSEQFREEDWQRREELPECQVWQSKLQPQLRIQSHDIYTQNTAEVEKESRMFELRKRNPLLVAAYFLQLQPKEEFCSFHNRHSLFLQRVPIRLSDIEHVPYPDYLHLYDSCIKGYAQLARHVGYFIVDEGMVGINQQCVAKAWLSEDFASCNAFNTNITEETMVCSLLQTLDRSIDADDLPSNVPLIRDYLNRGKGAKSFDSLLWQFGDFIRIYNYGQVPIRLDCIDRAGGIAVIANREKNAKMGRSNVSNRKIGSQVKGSQVEGRVLQNNTQTRSVGLIQPVSALPNVYSNQVIYYPQQTYQSQVRNPLVLQQNGLKRSQIAVLPSLPIAQHLQQVAQQPQPQLYYQSVRSSQVSPQQKFTHRAANAPKFTVQVIPGKVYPQKSSTIFLSSSKAIPAASSQPQKTLDSIHPIIATSQKDVIKEDLHQAQHQQIHSLINSESGNMRSYTVDEEKYSPDNLCYERETHEIGKEEPELQSYIPHMQATAAFKNVETIREQQPDPNQELLVSFNPANLRRDLQQAALPVYSRQEEWQSQAHFINSEGQLSPRDEEPVIVEYADNREGLLQSANFGLQSYNNEAYNAAPLIEKEEEPTLYNNGSYGQASYSGFDHNDGKSSLQLMRQLAGARAFLSNQSQTATEPSYRPSASTSDYYSKYLASLTQELPSFPEDSEIRETGTFRL